MADLVFIQRSRFGRSIFTLREDDIDITSHLFSSKRSANIPYRGISPDYSLMGRHFWPHVVVCLVLGAFCFAQGYCLFERGAWAQFFINALFSFGAMFVVIALRLLPRLETFTFKDHWDRPLFSILRERKQTEECNAFVQELLARIERTDAGVPSDETGPAPRGLISAVSLAADAPVEPQPENRWILAIVSGATSAIFPFVAYFFAVASLFVLPIVVVATTCALISGFLSFSAKERHRYWAVLGILLALVQVVF